MRSRNFVTVLASALLAGLALTAQARRPDDEKLDKKVLDVVKQVGDLYKNAKSLHADVSVETNIERNGEKQKLESEGSYDVEKPNHFALRSHVKGNKDAGLDVVCDGKNLFVSPKGLKKYTEAEAPADLTGMGPTLLRLGQQNTGILFANILGEDPEKQLMDGVLTCTYAGKEKVGGVEAHHLKFTQDQFNWELWVATEGKPFVLKMSNGRSGDGGSFSAVETYRNWKLDPAPAKDTFAFTPPKDATKVEKLDGGSSGSSKDK